MPPYSRGADGALDSKALIHGLDHIPVAVRDLDAAADLYRRLGFVLKQGRPHDNGLRNLHAKFPDGTEIELITASRAQDDLSAEYLRRLKEGDGPAFLALYAPDLERVAARLEASGRSFRRGGGLLTFPESDPLRYLFFGSRNRSPTDRPEHFLHPNGAQALMGVWLAADDFSTERKLLTDLGATFRDEEVHVPQALMAPVARFPGGEIDLLPGARRIAPGRKIVGATVRVRDLAAARSLLARNLGKEPPVIESDAHRRILISPEVALGMWLEFREIK
jgi:catechol 2,3-dioxygenase-like lactoylglutathione lyase family enzyme